MAATNGAFTNNLGQTLGIHFHSAGAPGTYCPLAKSKIPLATDPVDFRPQGDSVINALLDDDSIVTGIIQLEEDGNPMPYVVNLATHHLDVTYRPGLSIPIRGGHTYRWKVLSVLTT